MVLAGSINKSIVNGIQQAGGKAVGISGKDGKLLIAERMRRTKADPHDGRDDERSISASSASRIRSIPGSLNTIIQSDAIPVVGSDRARQRRGDL